MKMRILKKKFVFKNLAERMKERERKKKFFVNMADRNTKMNAGKKIFVFMKNHLKSIKFKSYQM